MSAKFPRWGAKPFSAIRLRLFLDEAFFLDVSIVCHILRELQEYRTLYRFLDLLNKCLFINVVAVINHYCYVQMTSLYSIFVMVRVNKQKS